MKHKYVIRRMIRDEVDFAIDLAAAEGWNPGIQDADCFYPADPKGFLMGLLDDEPIGCISVVAYDDSFGFLGFYIVKPKFRGRGFGIQLWNAGMAYLRDRNVGLDGVVEQQENYKKSGFRLAHRNIRYQGSGGGHRSTNPGIVELSSVPFEDLKAYDNALFPAPRRQFLECWISQPKCIALGMMEHGNLRGYGVLRMCRVGFKIGPLFADNETVAEELYQALRSHAAQGDPIFLDTPEVNPAAVALAERHAMKKVFETARMYTKGQPEISLDRWFGVTTFELG